jgi:hypothetical protein
VPVPVCATGGWLLARPPCSTTPAHLHDPAPRDEAAGRVLVAEALAVEDEDRLARAGARQHDRDDALRRPVRAVRRQQRGAGVRVLVRPCSSDGCDEVRCAQAAPALEVLELRLARAVLAHERRRRDARDTRGVEVCGVTWVRVWVRARRFESTWAATQGERVRESPRRRVVLRCKR